MANNSSTDDDGVLRGNEEGWSEKVRVEDYNEVKSTMRRGDEEEEEEDNNTADDGDGCEVRL